LIETQEHSIINLSFDEETLKKFDKFYNENNPKYLGIHREFEDNEIKLKSYYYIGYRWLDDEEYIHISPKSYKGYQIDYLGMFLSCLKDPIVSNHLGETYEIFFNEKWIEVDSNKDYITPFLIIHFLKIVNKITKKGLKKGYIKVTENLTSKIKGRISINQTIKHNHFKNRFDKTICNYQTYTINCIENRILKTALLQCSKHLSSIKNDEIIKLLNQNLNLFELVEVKEVFNSDFAKIKHSPFYKEYKEALKLAQMIFKRFGFRLNDTNNNQKHKIPPFYINMPELFERYVEIELRKKYKDNLISGYGQKNGNSYVWGLRPDFFVKNKKLIIDAKYKYWFDENEDYRFKDDYQQLSLYGRVKKIRKDIGLLDNEEAKLLFIYPKIDEETKNDNENKFNNISKEGIEVPFVKKY
jgi:5-methylcytosine-specific restriction enzyme subunit McrC